MQKAFFSALVFSGFFFISCSNDSGENPIELQVDPPATYTFARNGSTTVDFSGQTTRLLMGGELEQALKDPSQTVASLQAKYAHQAGVANFNDADLNASDKNLKTKTAASAEFFSSNSAAQADIRADFDSWLEAQATEVFRNWNTAAAPGIAGQIADGSSTRYVSGSGLEYDQLVIKGLMGAVMTDQALNNYLSPLVLDEGDNVSNNDSGVTEDGKNYTTMEHKWDEAYGYVFGLNADPANPNNDLGADSFLNKYVGRVESDPDFSGIADQIYQAFKLGRAAIVAGNYEVRDEQAALIRGKISDIIGIRAVYYLIQAKLVLEQPQPAYGTVFHDLSEAYGFIYSLQFTRKPGSQEPYFSRAEVQSLLTDLVDDGSNGLWDVQPQTLQDLADSIAERFDFTVSAAGS
ncbi:protein of unknown function [Muriicola jejuensis]|uniref:DUF4856 domain-containing protein n=1 Tax=Muriicola jejuensis TaxID=504488 RepID=A0A6P0UCF8_9FLAO|nr:DUF4856 domain-containing protein [Muriicola jejuensis]NER10727.1 DUF4856 domain-containing protein [Muriicola jejuensis]SMP16582.1 protein of unknown function [Muriicola jejuensis]